MTQKRLLNWLFALLMLAYAAYAAVFISETVFTVKGKPYTALFDDAMISMTYARNLAQGYGPVWNPGGEHVEGYTNPLWVGYMAVVQLFPIPENMTSLAVEISGAVFLLAALFFLKLMAERVSPGQPAPVLLAVLLTAFYYPLTQWSLLGTEVSLLVLMVCAATWWAFRIIDTGQFSWGLYLLLGISTLVRADMTVTYATLCGFLFLVDAKNRWKHLAWGAGMFVLFMGGQTLWRRLYYGEWAPMTYYLKMTGIPTLIRMRRGLEVLYVFAKGTFIPVMLFPITVYLFRRDRKVVLAGLVFLAQVAYSVYVGGDAWEHRGGANRFISLGMPAFMLLYGLAAYHWFQWGRSMISKLLPFPRRGGRGRGMGDAAQEPTSAGAGLLASLALGVFILGSLVMFNKLLDFGAPWLNLRNLQKGALRFVLLQERSIYMPGSQRYVNDGLIVRAVTAPGARVVVGAAGNTCYFVHRFCIDEFGKSDPVIAMGPIQVPLDSDWNTLRPGHVKWNYAYTIGQLQPDVVFELQADTVAQGEQYLTGYEKVKLNGHFMYFKQGSPYVNWEELNRERQN